MESWLGRGGEAQIFFLLPGEGLHQLWPENPLDTIDLTYPGGGGAEPLDPLFTPLAGETRKYHKCFS